VTRASLAALLFLALALRAAPALAAFADLGAGARAPGLGGAFVPIADDAYSIYYNPAGLALLERPEFASSYTKLLLGLTDGSQLSTSFFGYAHPLRGGERGTAALGFQQFALSSLYQEQQFYLSYGRALSKLGPGTLYGGGSFKLLRHSFGDAPESANALQGLIASGQADPVLNGKRSATAPDLDAGFLYRLPEHYSAGLFVGHLNRPNVAFSASDKDQLPLTIKTGLGYRSLLSNVAAQLETAQSPAGGLDQKIILGAERWFPWLFVGNIGLRGALAAGSRDYKQLSTGATYQTKRFQVDYSFSIPINGVSTVQGTHRFGFSIRFGSAKEPEESVALVLDAMRQLKAGRVPDVQAKGQGLSQSQKVLLEEQVAHAKALVIEARYAQAQQSLGKALALGPEDPQLLKSFGRLNFVSTLLNGLPDYKTDPAQASWHQGVLAYLAYDDAAAIDKVSYALSLKPDSRELDAFLNQLELATGLKRRQLPKVSDAALELEKILTRAASAVEDGRYDEAIALSREVLARDPENLSAWENLGISYFAQSDYEQSAAAWEKALSLEKNPARRAALASHLKSVKRMMERPKSFARPNMLPVPVEKVQQLYNQGLDFYAAGQLEKAKAAFEQASSLDPNNTAIRKALIRVQEELKGR
jgi:tetratricopeptide (TPR) repeat protein